MGHFFGTPCIFRWTEIICTGVGFGDADASENREMFVHKLLSKSSINQMKCSTKSNCFNLPFVSPSKPQQCHGNTRQAGKHKGGEHPVDVPPQADQPPHPRHQGPLVHLVARPGHHHCILKDQANAPLSIWVEVGESRLVLNGPTGFWAPRSLSPVPEGFQQICQFLCCPW